MKINDRLGSRFIYRKNEKKEKNILLGWHILLIKIKKSSPVEKKTKSIRKVGESESHFWGSILPKDITL
jgi:hypothetical protein